MSSPLITRARSGYLQERPLPPWVTHPAALDGIHHMLPDGNRLYLTHGTSWDGGAHHLAWIDLDTGEPITGPLQPTEGFSVIRKINGRLFALWADPTASWDSSVGYSYSDDNGQTWQHKLVGSHFHVLDIREHAGGLYLAGAGQKSGGSQVEHATVWRSLDNGDTWERSLAVDEGGPATRVYSLLPAGGDLWCIVSGTDTPYKLDGDEWIARPDIPKLPAYPRNWQLFQEGRVVEAGGVSYGTFGAFDGRFISSNLYAEVVPGFADATHVYGMQTSVRNRIMRAPLITPGSPGAVVAWEEWIPLDERLRAQSVTYHNGYFYVGGTLGRIWRFPAP